MPLQEEVLLMILVVALYLYDSMALLYCNEGILVPTSNGWKVRFGFREPKIRGKELFIPAPWLPHRPMFRLAWQFDGNSAPAAAEPLSTSGRTEVSILLKAPRSMLPVLAVS